MDILLRGSRGEDVRRLQLRLNELGYRDNSGTKLAVDGSFGTRTEQAVNLFKDTNLPHGNAHPWRGQVGATTWAALGAAVPIELPCTPSLPFIPPRILNTPSNNPWSKTELDGFILMESGVTVIWDGVQPRLLACRDNFINEITKKGWSIRFTSVKRFLIYQAHFWDIVKGESSRTAAGREHARRHGLGTKVSQPNPNAPHVRGVAFDAVITDEKGVRLNPMKGKVNAELLWIANNCGFRSPPSDDGVHWQLMNT
jgi:hypothetical protein